MSLRVVWVAGPPSRTGKVVQQMLASSMPGVPCALPSPLPPSHEDDVILWLSPGPSAVALATRHPERRFLFVGDLLGLPFNVRRCPTLVEAFKLLRAFGAPEDPAPNLVPQSLSDDVTSTSPGQETRGEPSPRRSEEQSGQKHCPQPEISGRRPSEDPLDIELSEEVRVHSHVFPSGRHLVGDPALARALLDHSRRRSGQRAK